MEKMLNSIVDGDATYGGGEGGGVVAQLAKKMAKENPRTGVERHFKSAINRCICKGCAPKWGPVFGRGGEGQRIILLVTGIQQLSQKFPDHMVNYMGILQFFTLFYISI